MLRLIQTVLRASGFVACIALAALPFSAGANSVLEWNETAFRITVAGGQNPIVLSRTVAMMHLAVHDALNAIDRRYEPYLHDVGLPPQSGAAEAADAAVAAAAHGVLGGVASSWGSDEQRAQALTVLEQSYAAALARIAEGEARQRGLAIGAAAARSMLEARKSDGSGVRPTYAPQQGAGRWRPHPNPVPANPPIADPAMAVGNWPALQPQWATLTPFTMVTAWQFRLPGPPDLASPAYARDFDEVKRLGGAAGSERTEEQSAIARYWYEGSPQGWSRIARIVAAERGLDRWESARLLALVNVVIADGYVAGADTRYHFDRWRPVTAIREAADDGNDSTMPDPSWHSYLNTPPLPDYPSTHSVAGGAAAVVLARFFGDDAVAFTMTSGPPFPGLTRSFRSFSEAARENGDSRVYAGVHFRSACVDGVALGERIGRRAFAHFLRPAQEWQAAGLRQR